MKILFVCEKIDGTDGWSRHTVNLGNALEERGHTTMYCCTTGGQRSVISDQLPPPLRMLTRPFIAPIVAIKIAKACKDFQPDVIHFTVEPYALAVLFLPKNLLKKCILTFHGNYGIRPLRLWTVRWIWPVVLRRIPRFITVSHYTKKVIIEELKRTRKEDLAKRFEERTTVVHNGIPLQQSAVSSQQSATNEKKILHVGGVKPAKGVGEAVMACRFFREQSNTPFHFTIIGTYDQNDPYVRHLRLCIAEEDLEGFVSFSGLLSDEELAEEYTRADLLLVPSYTTETSFEGFGLVYIEANAYGVPVIGPDTSGAAEAIKNGRSGFTVHVYDPAQIAERMRWILDDGKIDPGECRRWAQKHDSAIVAESVESVYSGMVPRPRP